MKNITIILIVMNISFSQNQLIIPPAMIGNNFDLTLQESEMEFFPGIFTQTMGVPAFARLKPIMETRTFTNLPNQMVWKPCQWIGAA